MPRKAVVVTITAKQREILDEMADARRTPQGLAQRASIVLASAQGVSNEQQARCMGVDRRTIRLWRERWAQATDSLAEAEQQGQDNHFRDLRDMIMSLLSDKPRPGAPVTFTPEQLASILSLACEDPEKTEQPFSHWTARELARQAVERGLVSSISARHVGRFLKGGGASASQESLLDDVPR